MHRTLPVTVAAATLLVGVLGSPAAAQDAAAAPVVKTPTATGYGGAVATVDADATRVGLQVLRRGGNAADAAVAAAATLGVTEPYSAGVGGGGFFVYYEAETGLVSTIDGRETAPQAMRPDSFVEGGAVIPFAEAVTSGLSAGVPGTPATWDVALEEFGTTTLAQALRPAEHVARRGFVVDQTFRDQTAANEARFRDIPTSRELFLPGGELPAVGSTFRNRDLAATYHRLGREGVADLYGGRLGRDVVAAVQAPPVDPAAARIVRPGLMQLDDLVDYEALQRVPTRVRYRGLDVYGMAPPSSGGSTVGEALNVLETDGRQDRTRTLHRMLEASALAFADRNRYVGDPAATAVPLDRLLSEGFAADRAACIGPVAAVKPVPAGTVGAPDDGVCGPAAAPYDAGTEGLSTTHLTVVDGAGNVASYTLTIESTGGSAITVPGRGFLLNNELTDFDLDPRTPGPNLPAAGKRPRSSMAPTIVLRGGRPVLAVGSPGGSTIITTVLQVLVERYELGRSLPEAVAAPRASQRNTATVQWEPGFDRAPLEALGHRFAAEPTAEIGAVAGIELLPGGRLVAAAEPTRRGGGSAGVVSPTVQP